jgi:hypothetical protein
MDSNLDASRAAEAAGFKVIFGNALEESSMVRAQMDSRYACIAVTTNEEINLLFARRATEEFKVGRLFVALQKGHGSVTAEMVQELGAQVLFGRERDLELWDVRFRRGTATMEHWELRTAPKRTEKAKTANVSDPSEEATPAMTNPAAVASSRPSLPPAEGAADRPDGGAALSQSLSGPGGASDPPGDSVLGAFPDALLPLSIRKGSRRVPISRDVTGKKGDQVWFAIFEDKREEAEAWLCSLGWVAVPADVEKVNRTAE